MADRPAPVRSRRSLLARGVRQMRFDAGRSLAEAETMWLLGLASLSVAALLGGMIFHSWWPLISYVIPLVLAMNVLSIGRLLVLDVVIAVCLVVSSAVSQLTPLRIAAIGVLAWTALFAMWQAARRIRLGMARTRGESMLVDLRDRLASQSQLPALPRCWHAEAVMHSAGGASFAGDFIVAAKTVGGERLEVAVVDVSGMGLNAGTRALQLSGAFGGLLGSLPPCRFLGAANEYLLRQEWSEGFATTAHVAVDLSSGAYEVRTAGHPPALHFHAGSGRWAAYWTDGPVLGLVTDAEYTVHHGTMSSGDALLLYTDGLVETPQRDITFGIDKLLGEAEKLVTEGFEGGADRLVKSVDAKTDDRALFLLHRR